MSLEARRGRRVAVLLLASLASALPAGAQGREFEVGLENLYFQTAATALNRDDVLRLGRHVDLLRATLSGKESRGGLRLVFRGVAERRFAKDGARTDWLARQAYAQYAWGSGLSLRLGKQRVAWGSGFAWNPTNRLEPAKNPFNTGLEQEGVLAARMDWTPSPWAGLILVAARGDNGPGDRPFAADRLRRRTAAVRARFLVKDTDLAVVVSGGRSQRTLVGLDLGRSVGPVSLHSELTVMRGAELAPPRDGGTFVRVAAGALHTRGDTAVSLEYFRNGDGYTDAEKEAWLGALETSARQARDPGLPGPVRAAAGEAYGAAASLPYAGGLGLRRHYLQAAWTQSGIRGQWTASVRGVVGLSDGGTAWTPGLSYAPRGDLLLSLDAVLLAGPADSEFRLAPLRGAVQARLKVLF